MSAATSPVGPGAVRVMTESGNTFTWDRENLAAALQRVALAMRRAPNPDSRQRLIGLRTALVTADSVLASPDCDHEALQRRFGEVAVAMAALTSEDRLLVDVPPSARVVTVSTPSGKKSGWDMERVTQVRARLDYIAQVDPHRSYANERAALDAIEKVCNNGVLTDEERWNLISPQARVLSESSRLALGSDLAVLAGEDLLYGDDLATAWADETRVDEAYRRLDLASDSATSDAGRKHVESVRAQFACIDVIMHDGTMSPNARRAKAMPQIVALRRRLEHAKRHKLSERDALDAEIKSDEAALKIKQQQIVVLRDDLLPWMRRGEAAGFVLERNDCSRTHKLVASIEAGLTVFADITASDLQIHNGVTSTDAPNHFESAHSFVVEHNWAAAFKGAADFDGGEFKLPYAQCAFEFRINGRSVIAGARETAVGDISLVIFLEGGGFWFCDGAQSIIKAQAGCSLEHFLALQVRAISIALDAEVATHSVVRVSETLNRARAKKGKAPLLDYHVVSLARRARAEPGPSTGGESGTHKRLHFCRGHWRHYPSHRTWIKWCLKGDPSLGFVDKEYKL